MSSTTLRRLRLLAVDVALAAAVFVFEFGAVLSAAPPWSTMRFGPEDAIRLAGLTAPLLVRRRFPIVVLGVVTLSFVGSEFLGPPLVVAYYSAGASADDRRVSAAAAAVSGVAVTAFLVAARGVAVGPELLLPVAAFGGAWWLGDLSRVRAAYTAALEEKAERLEGERRREAEQAVRAERTRIARELHDIVAHRVSLMTVQAAAARLTATADTSAAIEAMGAVEAEGRKALGELRRVLGVMRSDEPAPAEEGGDAQPQPGLAELRDLAADIAKAGVRVELDLQEARETPEAVALSAYRIVQEALTNVLKHAGPNANARVTVTASDDALHIEVADDGRGPNPLGDDRGHGLAGIRERAALFGGEATAGRREGGGFVVRARLPL